MTSCRSDEHVCLFEQLLNFAAQTALYFCQQTCGMLPSPASPGGPWSDAPIRHDNTYYSDRRVVRSDRRYVVRHAKAAKHVGWEDNLDHS